MANQKFTPSEYKNLKSKKAAENLGRIRRAAAATRVLLAQYGLQAIFGEKRLETAKRIAAAMGVPPPTSRKSATDFLASRGEGLRTVKQLRATATLFYESEAWRDVRYRALKRCGRRCLVCGATPKDGAVLHVDHIEPRSLRPDLELDIDNLQVLCKDCNLGKSNRDSIDWR